MNSLVENVAALELYEPDQKQAHKTIARYCARLIDGQRFRREIGKLSVNTRDRLVEWRRHTEDSQWFGVLWRVIVKGREPYKWHVDPADVAWVLDNLMVTDRRRLARIINKQLIPTKRFRPHLFEAITIELNKFCRQVVWSNLRWVFSYDFGIGAEDLVSELMEYAIRALRRKENHGSRPYATNYAKQAVRNRSRTIAKRSSCRKRARIVATSKEDQQFVDREYVCLMADLDAASQCQAETDSEDLVTRIGARFGATYAQWARCVLGSMPDFDRWVSDWYESDPQDLPVIKVSRLASKWIGLQHKQLVQIGGMLSENPLPS